MELTGLPPILAPGFRVLVLGSMPGAVSLERGEYYAHVRNRFWPVMGELCGAHPRLPYQERIERLTASGIAVWDVIHRCERVGSLDTSIVRGSEVPNDLPGVVASSPSLRAIAFNGGKAAGTFRGVVLGELSPDDAKRVTLLDLPSTSPANATWSLARLVRAWSVILPYLDAPLE